MNREERNTLIKEYLESLREDTRDINLEFVYKNIIRLANTPTTGSGWMHFGDYGFKLRVLTEKEYYNGCNKGYL